MVDSHQPAVEWIIDQYSQRFDLETATGKRELSTHALAIIRNLKDPVEQEHYIRRVAEVTGASVKALEGKLDLTSKPAPVSRLKPMSVSMTSGHDPEVHQDYLLGLAAIDTSVHDALRHLETDAVAGDVRRTLLGYILAHRGAPLPEPLPEELQNIQTYVKIVTFKAETRYGSVDSSNRLIETANLVRRIKDEQRKQKKAVLTIELRRAEEARDTQRIGELRSELSALIKESTRAK